VTAAHADGFDHAVAGVVPVLEVPFDDDGAVDLAGFEQVIDHVLDTGVSAVMWPGLASEFYKLSDGERTVLRQCLLGRVRNQPDTWAIIGITEHASRLALEAAIRAAEAGADALNVLPPFLLSPCRDAVLDHLHSVLAAVAPLPVIIQYAPRLAATSIGTADLTYLAAEHQNLRMVKVDDAAAGPLLTALQTEIPRLASMIGYAGISMLDALRHGARGVQPGCSFIEVYQQIWNLWQDGRPDDAASLHSRMLPYLRCWMQEIELIIQVEKSISQRRGWIRSDHCRAPGRKLDAADSASVSSFLAEFAELLHV
jgi:dihydrodipicolinate synthase/N-acetylneuraminate lyase